MIFWIQRQIDVYKRQIVLFPGVFALVKNYVLEKVFRKYRTPEDLARELEMTREYRN